MTIEFCSLPWHDAEILSICIDRRQPGESDTVSFSVRWLDDSVSIVTFLNCYAFIAEMNFGVIAPESIRSADVFDINQKDTEDLYLKWKGIGIDLSLLKCYQIETNSTGSKILIYAFNFELSPRPAGWTEDRIRL